MQSLGRTNFHEVLAAGVIFWAICPPLQYSTMMRIVACLCAVIWFSLALPRCRARKYHCMNVFVTAFIFGLLMLCMRFFMTEGTFFRALTKCLHTYIFLLILCIGNFYLEDDQSFLIKISYSVVSLSAGFALITFYFCLRHPNLARSMVYSAELGQNYSRLGVGGYGLAFSCIFYCLAILYIYRYLSQRLRYIALGCLGVMTLMIFKASFLIAFLLTLMVYLMFFLKIYTRPNAKKTLTYMIVSVFLVGFFIRLLLMTYGDFLIDFMADTPYALKTKDIVYTFNGMEGVGKVDGRLTRYMASLGSAFKFFFTGSILLKRSSELGHHSVLLDTLAYYGVFVSSFYYYTLHKGISAIKCMTHDKGFYYAYYLLIVLLGILDNYVGEFAVPFFIVVPAAAIYRSKFVHV